MNILEKCEGCNHLEPNGIMMSAVPECMKYKEYASEAVKYCEE